jgi:hypothetical protein
VRVVSERVLVRALAALGISRESRTWRCQEGLSRLLVRDTDPELVENGPHRRIALPAEETVVKLRVGDRPRLGEYISRLLALADVTAVYAATRPGAYWLNNRGYADYLRRVPDAQRVNHFLRRVGLTDRFRGGFLIQQREFATVVPMLASQAFCGAPDVLFAAVDRPLTALACREFDVHVEARDETLIAAAQALACEADMEVVGARDRE